MINKNVTFQHPEYNEKIDSWQLVDDAVSGENVERFIPYLNKEDSSQANIERNKNYKKRAVYYNLIGGTLDGYIGLAFENDPIVRAPEYITNDIDGAGTGIALQSIDALKETLKKGKFGLLVDYPETSGETTLAQQKAGLIRPVCIIIKPENITNWKYSRVGSTIVLSLVVIKESVIVQGEDGFSQESITQYRVLKLTDGVYYVELWRKNKDKWELYGEPIAPRDSAGNTFNSIMFQIVDMEYSPLLSLAKLNIAHYRNSADYEDSAFFCGQVQPYITGLTEEWRDHLEETGIYVGSRSPILLPENSDFGMGQAQPNMIPFEAMKHKEAQMLSLGAKVVEHGSAIKTATQAGIENKNSNSILSFACTRVSEAYQKALEMMAAFSGETGEFEFEISKEFMGTPLDPQMLISLIQAWQSGRYPSSELWAKMREGGIIRPGISDEDIRDELENEPTGLGLE